MSPTATHKATEVRIVGTVRYCINISQSSDREIVRN